MSVGAPGWDGSGKALYYLRTRGRVVDLMRVALDGDGAAAPPEIIRAGLTAGNPETFLAFQPPPSLSADGSRLVYTQRQEWSNLALMDFDQWQQGKPPRMLTAGSASYESAQLSPDERFLAVERNESEDLSLQLLPLDGGPPTELGRLNSIGGISWSPRGDRLAVAAVVGDVGRGLTTFPVMALPRAPTPSMPWATHLTGSPIPRL